MYAGEEGTTIAGTLQPETIQLMPSEPPAGSTYPFLVRIGSWHIFFPRGLPSLLYSPARCAVHRKRSYQHQGNRR